MPSADYIVVLLVAVAHLSFIPKRDSIVRRHLTHVTTIVPNRKIKTAPSNTLIATLVLLTEDHTTISM